MKSLDLYKFITENTIEWHYQENDNINDVIMFVPFFLIQDFKDLLSSSIFDDEGIVCHMKSGYFCFWMQYICDYYAILMEEIFVEN